MSERLAIVQTIDCRLRCDVPSGTELHEVPTPRHDWGDVIVCPNEDCGKAFLVVSNPHDGDGRGSDDA